MDALRTSSVLDQQTALPLPECVALLLQGGGALGSYQAGVYQELDRNGIEVDWVAGISIGAVNAAIIAGNPPEDRMAKLRSFWDTVSASLPDLLFMPNDGIREVAHLAAASAVAMFGVPGFFHPHFLPTLMAQPGSASATSLYDSSPLIATLNNHIDWDLLNDGPVRLSVGAVDVESGNFIYFDTRGPDRVRIDHRHIMASGALPPGLPAIQIDGRHYWDGGLVSNTPLAHVLDHQQGDMLIFQVDLFPAEGPLPLEITDVWSRTKEIQYSSRTRHVTDQYLAQMKLYKAVNKLLAKLPPEMADDPEVKRLKALIPGGAVNIVHLIYRSREWESGARDFEFSRSTMRDHWIQGQEAVSAVLHKGDLIAQNIANGKSSIFDLQARNTMKEKTI